MVKLICECPVARTFSYAKKFWVPSYLCPTLNTITLGARTFITLTDFQFKFLPIDIIHHTRISPSGKQRQNALLFIAGSSKCTTKDLSCLLTKLLSTIKDGLVRYCNTKTSRNGVDNMWILKNSTSLLSSLDQLDVRTAKSVQTFDFSTLYTSIPHDLLKSRISNLVHNAFRKKDGSVRYTHIKLTRAKGYFTHDINGGGDNMFAADSICKMIEFLIDNIFVQFGGRLFRQVIGIPMGTNCAPLLADLFLYSYENEFLDNMIRNGHRRLARSFNLCYRYIDDLIVFNNKKFLDYLKYIHPSWLLRKLTNQITWQTTLISHSS